MDERRYMQEWKRTRGVRELVPVLSRVEAGQEAMTPELLLRVVETLSPWMFGSGVNLFAYYTSEDHEAEDKAELDAMIRHSQIAERWHDAWCDCARSEWLDAFADVLIQPPLGWSPNEDFAGFFFEVAGRFPDKAVQVLALLLGDEKLHPRIAQLLRSFHEYRN